MGWLWRSLGHAAWWCSYPVMWFYLHDSERTRLLIINEENKLLVVKGWLMCNNNWTLPGGGLHAGETPLSGMLREVREETGLKIQPKNVRNLGSETIKSKGFRFRLHFYSAPTSGEPEIAMQRFEIIEAKWIDLSTLNSTNAEPDVLRALQLWKA